MTRESEGASLMAPRTKEAAPIETVTRWPNICSSVWCSRTRSEDPVLTSSQSPATQV